MGTRRLEVKPADGYVLATDADDFLITCEGSKSGRAIFDDDQPAASAIGHTINPYHGLVRNGLTGSVYLSAAEVTTFVISD